LKDKGKSFVYYLLALNGSNDVSDAVQLFIFNSGIENIFSLYDEFASISSFHSTKTAEDFVMKVRTLTSLGLKWATLKSVTLDGMKNICGS
jgi:hypothetical protein